MKPWIVPALLSLALPALALAQTGGAAPPARPAAAQSPAALRAAALAAALAEDPRALRALIAAAFTPQAAQEAVALYRTRHIQGPARGARVEEGGANRARIVYRDAYAGRPAALLVEVEPDAPHRIVRVAPQRPPEEAVAVPATQAGRLKAIDAYAARLSAADVFSGVVMIAREGAPIYQRAFGPADRSFAVPNRIDTKFNLGSMNKMLTSIAIGQLMEAGKLSLDDPLSRFVPDFPDVESARKIRLKHLLSHTSGLNSYFNEEYWRSSPSRFRDVASYMEVARSNAKMEFEPGSRWSYSNTGMLVLGRVVEIASGMDYYDYIRKNIYDRAGMKDSGSFETDAVVANRASGYETDFEDGRPTVRSGILVTPARGGPAGGGYSTAPDLLRLSQALLAGKLLKPETLELFTAPKPELNSPNYGYGFFIAYQGPQGRDIVGHPGSFGDGTCASLAMIRDADRPYAAIVLANGVVYGSCLGLIRFVNEMFPAAGSKPADRR